MKYKNVGIVAGKEGEAYTSLKTLVAKYGLTPLECPAIPSSLKEELGTEFENKNYFFDDKSSLDLIIALGGDGFMLHMLHKYIHLNIPIYGMNCGTIGFLMNEYREDDLPALLDMSGETLIHPLRMKAITESGEEYEAIAINEVSLLRKTGQAAHIKVSVDGKVHLKEMICDGVMVSTPAGSSAYNFSTGGAILPLKSNLLALTPISAFRPRRWRGALLPHNSTLRFDIMSHEKRPVNAVADFREVKNVISVEVVEERDKVIRLLFNPGHSLEERIISEQFAL